MSRIFERGMAWHTYLNLEKDFTDTIRYVALDVNNRTVWSEKLAQQLLLTGSILDSVFKPFAAFAQNRSPEWWDAYNDVKHRFFQNVIREH